MTRNRLRAVLDPCFHSDVMVEDILDLIMPVVEAERRAAAEAMRERCRLIAEEEMDGYTKQSNPGYLEARNIAKRIDELPLDTPDDGRG
jgi:hypothetical protein